MSQHPSVPSLSTSACDKVRSSLGRYALLAAAFGVGLVAFLIPGPAPAAPVGTATFEDVLVREATQPPPRPRYCWNDHEVQRVTPGKVFMSLRAPLRWSPGARR